MHVEILCGIPGSGKSTYAKNLKGNVVICSADDYFINPTGEYNFDPAKLGQAHGACLKLFIETCRNAGMSYGIGDDGIIIVDNTSISSLEIAPYIAIAQAYGIKVEIKVFRVSVNLAEARNIHRVPRRTLERMENDLHYRVLPRHWPLEILGPTG